MLSPAQTAEIERITWRYLNEVVEALNLCPWAKGARENNEVRVLVHQPSPEASPQVIGEALRAVAANAFADQRTAVCIVVIAGAHVDRFFLNDVRAGLCASQRQWGVAAFHPEAKLDLTNPARLVAYLRRAPNPFLQIVPFAVLDAARTPSTDNVRLVDQVAMLGGNVPAPRPDVAERIAALNHARVQGDAGAQLTTLLNDIFADRNTSYARLGMPELAHS